MARRRRNVSVPSSIIERLEYTTGPLMSRILLGKLDPGGVVLLGRGEGAQRRHPEVAGVLDDVPVAEVEAHGVVRALDARLAAGAAAEQPSVHAPRLMAAHVLHDVDAARDPGDHERPAARVDDPVVAVRHGARRAQTLHERRIYHGDRRVRPAHGATIEAVEGGSPTRVSPRGG